MPIWKRSSASGWRFWLVASAISQSTRPQQFVAFDDALSIFVNRPGKLATTGMRISVIGGSAVSTATYEQAKTVGQHLGERGHTVVCGGLGGVMEAVCRGATDAGGRTIGILPSADPADANAYVDVPIATGLGDARNALVALNGAGVIAIDGAYGTLSEIALSLNADRPVVGLDTHAIVGVEPVDTPQAAVDAVEIAVDDSNNDDVQLS